MLECVSLATDGRGYQKSLFVSMVTFVGSPSSSDMTFQHDRPWPVSEFALTEHDARQRMFSRQAAPVLLLISFYLFVNRMRPCMAAPILVPSFIRFPIFRLSRIDILWLGIRLLPTNYQPQPFRMPD